LSSIDGNSLFWDIWIGYKIHPFYYIFSQCLLLLQWFILVVKKLHKLQLLYYTGLLLAKNFVLIWKFIYICELSIELLGQDVTPWHSVCFFFMLFLLRFLSFICFGLLKRSESYLDWFTKFVGFLIHSIRFTMLLCLLSLCFIMEPHYLHWLLR
jgi:hypothetical protein